MPIDLVNLSKGMLVLLVCLGFAGCEFFKKKDKAPSYITVERVDFTTDNVGGSNSSKINDVWVSGGGQTIGTFGLPTKLMPILAEGPTRIFIQPGVIADGNPEARVTYPFFRALDTTINLKPGEVIPVRFTTRYNTAILRLPFLYNDDFEQPLLRTDTGVNSKAKLQVLPHPIPEPFEGAGFNYGSMSLDAGTMGFMEMVSKANMDIPQNSSPVYLEFDIKTTIATRVGVVAIMGNRQELITDLVVRPTDTWKKFYCFLSEEVNIANANSTFKVIFRSDSRGDQRHTMSLDNIRLLTYAD